MSQRRNWRKSFANTLAFAQHAKHERTAVAILLTFNTRGIQAHEFAHEAKMLYPTFLECLCEDCAHGMSVVEVLQFIARAVWLRHTCSPEDDGHGH